MRAFHLVLAIATLLTPLSAYGLSAQQSRASAATEGTATPRRSSSSATRSATAPVRPLNALWRNKPANVLVGFAGNSTQVTQTQPQTPTVLSSTASVQGDRRNLRNRLHLQFRTPLGWVRVRLAS
jgi:hypothetical protein